MNHTPYRNVEENQIAKDYISYSIHIMFKNKEALKNTLFIDTYIGGKTKKNQRLLHPAGSVYLVIYPDLHFC